MKGVRVRASVFAISAAGALGLAACAPRPAPPAPLPPPPPAPRPAPAPAPPPSPPPADWRDYSLSPGDWSLGSSGSAEAAAYGPAGAPSFVVRCDAGQRITLIRTGAASSQALVVRTTFGERRLPAAAQTGGLAASLGAADPLLDEMMFSRGHFLVKADGTPDLVIPAWAEPARVIEDCRG